MRVRSGSTTTYAYFVAVDSADGLTRKTGLSSFTVYRSRNNGTATVYTTPTISELSASNMPGVYALLLDEDTTITSGADTEEMALHITATGMVPVTRVVELYRREVTAGETLTVSSGTGNAAVQSIANNAITAASIATDAIGASELAADAVAEIQSGLMLAASYTAPLSAAGTRSALGMASANLDTQLGLLATAANLATVAGYVDTEVAAIKAKTDQLAFSGGAVVASATSIANGAISPDTFASWAGPMQAYDAYVSGAVFSGTSVTLTGASGTDDRYTGEYLTIPFNGGDNQVCRRILSYDGTTKVAIVEKAFPIANGTYDALVWAFPNNAADRVDAIRAKTDNLAFSGGSVLALVTGMNDNAISPYDFQVGTGFQPITEGTTQAAVGSTVTLETGSSSADDAYNGASIYMPYLPVPQARRILDYNGTTRVATIDAPFVGADGTDFYYIYPGAQSQSSVPTAADNAATLLAKAFEGAETVQDFLRLARAALYGKSSGMDTTSPAFRDKADAKNRIQVVGADEFGNRPTVNLDPS